MSDPQAFPAQITADGSFTFFSPEFQESFHSRSGARWEAESKFVEPCQLREKAKNKEVLQILDICYGLGYNSASALATIWEVNPKCKVELIGLERDPQVPQAAIAQQLLNQWDSPIPQLLSELARKYQLETSLLEAKLLIGDARLTIQSLINLGFQAEAIFLDPFSPPKCPQLWTGNFLKLVSKCLKPTGIIATYSCAASVRTALLLAGLEIAPTVAVGRNSPGTVASFKLENAPSLSEQEQEHLQTRASIPYRDPSLTDSATVIEQRRQQEQAASNKEPTSHWKKRWFNRS
ncbi:MAG: MnmC family methyltransferase [Oscillatoria sp. PMC 1051.18]|nr:MnmC family methyltransferase [Oscillatoria sp. PMC 1050.18]MEC5030967.1 MnmC family methyltransferase [Oscillatoria sp. PMC 1051.18]